MEFLTEPERGIEPQIAELALGAAIELPTIPPSRVVAQNAAVEIAERALAVKYPVIHVYVDRVRNLLTEKFRVFSGKVRVVAEVRVSQDRIEDLETRTKLYAEAVTHVLDLNRGDWGEGVFYSGGYEVTFEAMKHGGRNLLQVAKVAFEVDVSRG